MKKKWEDILNAALRDFLSAINEMLVSTKPATPLPRPRVFELAPGITWPAQNKNKEVEWDHISTPHNTYQIHESCGWICCRYGFLHVYDKSAYQLFVVEACGSKPRLVLRMLRRIQAAAAWCRAWAEGRKRMAEEILRQQAGAVEALEAEEALLGLKRI